jgi:hypothetical protein
MAMKTFTVAGIDVGGTRKGFHGVAFRDGAYLEKYQSPDPAQMARWVHRLSPSAIAIDAPCRWSETGRARPPKSSSRKS